MEVVPQAPKREWPKFLWGPDGRQARFDSPSDVPRDYFPTKDEAAAYVQREAVAQRHQITEPAAFSAEAAELEEFRAWKAKQAEKMAKARAARQQ